MLYFLRHFISAFPVKTLGPEIVLSGLKIHSDQTLFSRPLLRGVHQKRAHALTPPAFNHVDRHNVTNLVGFAMGNQEPDGMSFVFCHPGTRVRMLDEFREFSERV